MENIKCFKLSYKNKIKLLDLKLCLCFDKVEKKINQINNENKWRLNRMVKIRLRRLGYKKNPMYRIVVLNSTTKRETAPIEQLGYYNPKTKEMKLDKQSALNWVAKGAQPTQTVKFLIDRCNDDGTLNYEKKTVEKLSKKAQAKLEAEKAKTAEEAKAAETAEATEEASA